MAKPSILLHLFNEANDYQRALRQDAMAAAQRRGFTLEVESAGNDFVEQVRKIHACVHRPPELRPQFLMVSGSTTVRFRSTSGLRLPQSNCRWSKWADWLAGCCYPPSLKGNRRVSFMSFPAASCSGSRAEQCCERGISPETE